MVVFQGENRHFRIGLRIRKLTPGLPPEKHTYFTMILEWCPSPHPPFQKVAITKTLVSQASIAQLAVHGIIFRNVEDSFIQSPQILCRQLRSGEELLHQLLIEANRGCPGMHKKPTLKPQQPASWHSMVCATSICKINEKLLGFFFCVLHCHGAGQNYITHMARQAAERNPTQTGNF